MSRRALIADDHAMLRDGLRIMLSEVMNFERVEQADSLEDVFAILSAGFAPDLLIIDLRMPGVSGVKSFSQLRDRYPEMKMVVMSASENRADILECLAARLNGYIPKSLSPSELENALTEVLAGRIFAPSLLSQQTASVAEDSRAPSTPAAIGLTERQRQVLNELLRGQSSKQIARALSIAEGTVKIHLAAIYRSIRVRTRAEAIAKLSAQMRL